jgi:hypothetical protein
MHISDVGVGEPKSHSDASNAIGFSALRMSVQGHSRCFDRGPLTSGLPPKAEIALTPLAALHFAAFQRTSHTSGRRGARTSQRLESAARDLAQACPFWGSRLHQALIRAPQLSR